MAEPAVVHAVPVGYGPLCQTKILSRAGTPCPALNVIFTPSIALGREEPLQLWKPLQEETLGHPVLLEALCIV